MSIALDTALYLREQKLNKPLTLAERAVLITLMFRVGSNPFTWVSQESLSIELDLDISGVKRYMKKLSKRELIEVSKDPSDKRKNLYRPASFLINYHQQNNRNQTKKYSAKSRPISRDTAQNHHLNTAQNHHLSPAENVPEVIDYKQEIEKNSLPKEKEESNNKAKIKTKSVDNFVIPTWLDKELWSDFKEFRCELKNPLGQIGEKRAIAKLQKFKDEGYDPEMIIERSIERGWAGLFAYPQNKQTTFYKQEVTPSRSTYVTPEEALERDRRYWKEITRNTEH